MHSLSLVFVNVRVAEFVALSVSIVPDNPVFGDGRLRCYFKPLKNKSGYTVVESDGGERTTHAVCVNPSFIRTSLTD